MTSVFRPGERCGPYEIVRQLGEGGMGEIHLVRNGLGELRALKVLSANAQQNRELVKRFTGEIQVLSYLEHVHVVRFFDTGVIERNGQSVLWLVIEYLQGFTLREHLQTAPQAVTEEKIIRWGRQIAEGVHEAHKLKVIHRDLKPENVIIVADDLAKVIDFGIAKFRDWGDTRSRTSGAKVGTLLYMAPEQLDDALGVPIDARTDVYALGVILYELAIGKNPYLAEGHTIDMANLMVRKLAEDLPPVHPRAPRLSRELADVIDRACQHDSQRRFADMDQLQTALGTVRRSHMDARHSQLLGDGGVADASQGKGPRGEAPVAPAAWLSPVPGESSRFESVRTLPEIERPTKPRPLGSVVMFGATLGVASGLVLFRAVLEPRFLDAPQTTGAGAGTRSEIPAKSGPPVTTTTATPTTTPTTTVPGSEREATKTPVAPSAIESARPASTASQQRAVDAPGNRNGSTSGGLTPAHLDDAPRPTRSPTSPPPSVLLHPSSGPRTK